MAPSIREIPGKIKVRIMGFVEDDRWFSTLLIIVVGVSAFGLGRLSVMGAESTESIQKVPLRPSTLLEASSYSAIATSSSKIQDVSDDVGQEQEQAKVQAGYVASKNSDRYHLPWCSGALRISEANKVWFGSKEEAEAAGYKPAGNCKGI